jgi:hypothetical protein
MDITKPPTPDRVPYLLNLAAAMLDEAQTTHERVPQRSNSVNREPPRLTVGDDCVLLVGVSLYLVTVIGINVNLEGDPLEFAMYRVKSREWSTWIEDKSQHRSDLFKMPADRQYFLKRIEDDIDALKGLLREQEDAQLEDSERVPHDHCCSCYDCAVERAQDTAREMR